MWKKCARFDSESEGIGCVKNKLDLTQSRREEVVECGNNALGLSRKIMKCDHFCYILRPTDMAFDCATTSSPGKQLR